jgi:glucosamine 6-phosphate synthetase-like amidotransferase/phosphosugar isomerase protein
MCGLSGLLGPVSREPRARAAVLETFSRLLLRSEPRGPHATGVAWIAGDGAYQVEKAPVPARQFVLTPGYLHWLAAVPMDVTTLLGHTRWPTRGTVHQPTNNHPLVACLPTDPPICSAPAPAMLLTHNGVVDQPDRLAAQWGLPRQAAVDSEVLLQLAVRSSGPTGVDVPAYLAWLAQVPGRMALAVCDTHQPQQVLLVRGTLPLALAWHRRRRLLAYASEATTLQRALGGETGWMPVPFPMGQACLVDTHDVANRHWHPWTPHGPRQEEVSLCPSW